MYHAALWQQIIYRRCQKAAEQEKRSMATKEELEKIKRRSAAYWKKRSRELEEASFARGMHTYRDIEEVFNQAQRSLDKEIEKWYHRIADNNGLTMEGARRLLRADELEEFHWNVKEYIKAGKENAVNQSWMKELENASARAHISRLEALKIETQQALERAFGNEVDAIDKLARRTIDEDYLKTCFELQKGIGVGWPIGTIDNRVLDKIVSKPWAPDGSNFSDRLWTNKNKMIEALHQNLTRTCILGQAPDKAIAAMTQYVDKSIKSAKKAAATLVQTEQAYFHARAQQEAYIALGVEEFEVVATLDSHTSEICQEMDGQHFPMSQYEIGMTVPPFHPRCRSVTAPYFADDFGVSGQRAARRSDEESTYYVPDNMTYKEWKKEQDKGKRKWDRSSKKGTCQESYSVIKNGIKYVVDGKNVVIKPSENEKRIGNLLARDYGKEVKLLPKVNYPKGVRTPDFMVDDEGYDLKTLTGSGKNVLSSAIKKDQTQKIIYDLSDCPLDLKEIENQINRLFGSPHTSFIDEVVVIKSNDIIIVRYKNK